MRRALVLATTLFVSISAVSAEAAESRWRQRLRKATASRTVSVRVERGDTILINKRANWSRIPASNQKLVLSMAILSRLGPKERIQTGAFVETKEPPLADAGEPKISGGVLYSDLYVVGRGDPTLTAPGSSYGRDLSVGATRIADLAREVKGAGIERIAGRVVGVRSYFRHDWMAPGWKPEFPYEQVALPSALSINGNVRKGHHISEPEWRLARALTRKLEAMNVRVKQPPRAGSLPGRTTKIGAVESRPLHLLLGHMNRRSSNFFAEIFGKRLAVAAGRRPGTIADGAAVLARWARQRGVWMRARDASGLSYSNRISARGIVRLLRRSERAGWGDELFHSLPKAGWGTLEDRLGGVRLRAKTGTLDGVSSLSGWVWLRRSERWARFSIMINGRPSWEAKAIEDRIVRTVAAHF